MGAKHPQPAVLHAHRPPQYVFERYDHDDGPAAYQPRHTRATVTDPALYKQVEDSVYANFAQGSARYHGIAAGDLDRVVDEEYENALRARASAGGTHQLGGTPHGSLGQLDVIVTSHAPHHNARVTRWHWTVNATADDHDDFIRHVEDVMTSREVAELAAEVYLDSISEPRDVRPGSLSIIFSVPNTSIKKYVHGTGIMVPEHPYHYATWSLALMRLLKRAIGTA